MLFKILNNNTLNNVFLNSKFLNSILISTKIEYFPWLAKDTKAFQPWWSLSKTKNLWSFLKIRFLLRPT